MDRTDIAFLVTGIVIVVVVGRLLALTGRRYVGGAGGAGRNVGSVATLFSIVFHLVTLGVVALIAAVPTGDGMTSLMVRVGVLLLVLGVVYGVFVGALARRREVAITEAAVSPDQPTALDPRVDDALHAESPHAPSARDHAADTPPLDVPEGEGEDEGEPRQQRSGPAPANRPPPTDPAARERPPNKNPSVPSNAPSYLPPSGLPGDGS